MKPPRISVILLILITLLVTGCTSSDSFTTPTVNFTLTLTHTPKPILTATSTPTSTVTSTITPTPKPITWRITLGNFLGMGLDLITEDWIIITGPFLSPREAAQNLLFMVDQNGNVIWEKGIESERDLVVMPIQQTMDDGFIVVGLIQGETDENICLIKFDQSGNKIWESCFGETIIAPEIGLGSLPVSVQQTQDGGFIIVGKIYPANTKYPNVLLVKTDSSGNVEWENSFGESNIHNSASKVLQTSDGEFIFAGQTWPMNFSSFKAWIIKTDSEGNTIWEKTFGESGHNTGVNSIQQTDDGGFIFTGSMYPNGANYADVWLVKLDKEGHIEWQQSYGGERNDSGTGVYQISDGGYILLGNTYSFGAGDSDIWLIRTDENGNLVWDKTFGDDLFNESIAFQQSSDGGFVLLGFSIDISTEQGWSELIKTDMDGNIQSDDY